MMAPGRPLLMGLLLWALLMIVPDFVRVVRPLGSFGFYANNNGLIYDVVGPFADTSASPAWKAGLREGDVLDLSTMRCLPYDSETCGSVLAAVGGVQYVIPGRAITLTLAPTTGQEARRLTLVAEERPSNWLVRSVLILSQITGVLVVLAAAWLVWTRPGPMSWGFFLYCVWFNPGQSFEYYAQLQRWPLLLLAQDAAGAIVQAAGYAGLLLFVTRAPTDEAQPGWVPFERSLPYVAVAIAIALLASYGSLFGFKTEFLMRATILFGLIVSITAIAILVRRRRTLTPKDNQRLRWVLWGCLIGLPAFVIAELSQYTTIFKTSWGDFTLPEDVAGLLYLVNGVLCAFVFEAIRRRRVVNVSIPLRRATILALTLSVPALLLHREAEHLGEMLDVPQWTWFLIGAAIVFVIGRLHDGAVELADQFFNRRLDKAEREIGEAILSARNPAEIDHLLADGPLAALTLSSAVTFRRTEAGYYCYEAGKGWDDTAPRDLRLEDAMLEDLSAGKPCAIESKEADQAGFPLELELPILAVPAASRAYCSAVTLYGPHLSGADLDAHEREMLVQLGRQAADAYVRLENEHLRKEIKALQDAREPSEARV